jgi:hypothetical protein
MILTDERRFFSLTTLQILILILFVCLFVRILKKNQPDSIEFESERSHSS